MPKCVLKSNSFRNTREIAWNHRLNTVIPNGLNILDLGAILRRSQGVQQWYPVSGSNILYLTGLNCLE